MQKPITLIRHPLGRALILALCLLPLTAFASPMGGDPYPGTSSSGPGFWEGVWAVVTMWI